VSVRLKNVDFGSGEVAEWFPRIWSECQNGKLIGQWDGYLKAVFSDTSGKYREIIDDFLYPV
jgi:hypothetical protein